MDTLFALLLKYEFKNLKCYMIHLSIFIAVIYACFFFFFFFFFLHQLFHISYEILKYNGTKLKASIYQRTY